MMVLGTHIDDQHVEEKYLMVDSGRMGGFTGETLRVT